MSLQHFLTFIIRYLKNNAKNEIIKEKLKKAQMQITDLHAFDFVYPDIVEIIYMPIFHFLSFSYFYCYL